MKFELRFGEHFKWHISTTSRNKYRIRIDCWFECNNRPILNWKNGKNFIELWAAIEKWAVEISLVNKPKEWSTQLYKYLHFLTILILILFPYWISWNFCQFHEFTNCVCVTWGKIYIKLEGNRSQSQRTPFVFQTRDSQRDWHWYCFYRFYCLPFLWKNKMNNRIKSKRPGIGMTVSQISQSKTSIIYKYIVSWTFIEFIYIFCSSLNWSHW